MKKQQAKGEKVKRTSVGDLSDAVIGISIDNQNLSTTPATSIEKEGEKPEAVGRGCENEIRSTRDSRAGL